MEASLTDISQKLHQTWGHLERLGVMRASLFNLIVVCPDNERSVYLNQITQKVIERFPCRVIFIQISDHLKAGDLKVEVTATTNVGDTPRERFQKMMPLGLCQSPGTLTIDKGGSINSIQPPLSMSESQELSHQPEGHHLLKTLPKPLF
jgi:hypothetical protein